MGGNKRRLYVALYPSGTAKSEEQRYHWALLAGPKRERRDTPGVRYHVRNRPGSAGWLYEEGEVGSVQSATQLLARLLVAKIADEARLEAVIRATPVVQGDAAFRCRTWVADVLARLARDGRALADAAALDWPRIERLGRDYVGRKAGEGRYAVGMDMSLPKPTWDMLEGREIIA